MTQWPEVNPALGDILAPLVDGAPYVPASWRDFLKGPWDEGLGTVVAAHGNPVLGCALLARTWETADLVFLAVAPAARRRGIGRALVAAVQERCVQWGARLILEVGAANAPAQALYGACGFRQVSRRVRYYGGREDALVLQWAPGGGTP